jgi:hypothetical protein
VIQSSTDLVIAYGLYQNLQAARQVAAEIANITGGIQVALPSYPPPPTPLFVDGPSANQFIQDLITKLTAQLAALGVTGV